MRAWRTVTAGLRSLFHRRSVEQELDDELRHYLELATAENVRRGMSPQDAERSARMQMGGVEQTRARARWGGWEGSLEWLNQDARVAARGLRRSAGFTIVGVLSLTLGVAAVTTMFSVVNAVLFRPLPYRDADRLVMIWTNDVQRGLSRENTAALTIADWGARNSSFVDVAYFSTQRINPVSNDPARGRGRTRHTLVSTNLFALLGATPQLGRLISAADERHDVAVISHSFWQDWFDGDSNVVGRSLLVDDAAKGGSTTLTVIGVLPPEFWFPDRATQIYTPAASYWRFERESAERFQSWARRWTAVARLKSDATPGSAHADLDRIGQQLAIVHTTAVPDFPGFATTVVPVLDTVAGVELRSALWLLLGAVSVVLLVVCANLANLLLARGATRQREFAVRRALGAGRGRLVRQLLVESALLVLIGGTIGALIASWATPLLGAVLAAYLPRMDEIAFDARVLVFAISASLFAGMLFGIIPALRLSGTAAGESLRSAKTSGGRHAHRTQGIMVLAECALAIVLLACAGLLLKSLQRVTAIDPGFDPRHVLTMRLEFPTQAGAGQSRGASARVHGAAVLATRVADVPGVTHAGFIDDMFVSSRGNESISIPGRDVVSGELAEALVSPGFFEALRVPLTAGRLPTSEDAERKIRALNTPARPGMSLAEQERLAVPEPVIVNDAFVRRFFPGENPIGRRFVTDPTNNTYWYEIAGIVGNMHRSGPERAPIPEYYGSWIPSPGGRVDLVVRTAGNPLDVAPLIRQALMQHDPSISIVSVLTAEQQLGAFTAQRRMQTSLLAFFAAVAVALAAIGVFGLAHYAVAERAREIGVRLALGATPGAVLRLMMRRGMLMPVAGIAIGMALALGATKLVSSQLFGVQPGDPATFVAVSVLLGATALVACYAAARGVVRADPVMALRHE